MFLDSPPQLGDQERNDRRAWQAYGEIIFWMHKPGLSDAEVFSKCAPLWEKLQTAFPFEAVDPLMRLRDSSNTMTDSDRRPMREIFTRFREPIRRILEFGLGNLDCLTTIYRLGSSWLQKEHPEFIIQTLGEVGNLQTVKILEPHIESPELGPLVVEAIRRLKAGMQ